MGDYWCVYRIQDDLLALSSYTARQGRGEQWRNSCRARLRHCNGMSASRHCRTTWTSSLPATVWGVLDIAQISRSEHELLPRSFPRWWGITWECREGRLVSPLPPEVVPGVHTRKFGVIPKVKRLKPGLVRHRMPITPAVLVWMEADLEQGPWSQGGQDAMGSIHHAYAFCVFLHSGEIVAPGWWVWLVLIRSVTCVTRTSRWTAGRCPRWSGSE